MKSKLLLPLALCALTSFSFSQKCPAILTCGLNKVETKTDVTKTTEMQSPVAEERKTAAVLPDSAINRKLVRVIDCEKPDRPVFRCGNENEPEKPLEPSATVADGTPQTNILKPCGRITGKELTTYNPGYDPGKTNIATGNLHITGENAEDPATILEEATILPCRTINRCNIGCRTIYEAELRAETASVVSLTVFPNPSSEFIQLKTSNGSKITEVEILDLNGKSVFHESEFDSEHTRIEVSSYKTGVYFGKVNAGGKIYTEQLVVKH